MTIGATLAHEFPNAAIVARTGRGSRQRGGPWHVPPANRLFDTLYEGKQVPLSRSPSLRSQMRRRPLRLLFFAPEGHSRYGRKHSKIVKRSPRTALNLVLRRTVNPEILAGIFFAETVEDKSRGSSTFLQRRERSD